MYGFTPLHYAVEFDLTLGGGFDFADPLINRHTVNTPTDREYFIIDSIGRRKLKVSYKIVSCINYELL